jgi:hypothetical protein
MGNTPRMIPQRTTGDEKESALRNKPQLEVNPKYRPRISFEKYNPAGS